MINMFNNILYSFKGFGEILQVEGKNLLSHKNGRRKPVPNAVLPPVRDDRNVASRQCGCMCLCCGGWSQCKQIDKVSKILHFNLTNRRTFFRRV